MLNRRISTVLLLIIVLTVSLVIPARADEYKEPYNGFAKYIEDGMKTYGCPGLAIVIVKDDKIIYMRGFGVRKVGSPELVDEHTIFPLASISKQFTSGVIATLVDEGKMQWDAKVIDYLPWFQLYDAYPTRELTIRDLLLHRSGLPPTNYQWYGSGLSSDDILHRLKNQPLTVGFRQKQMYQNVGYLAAGTCAAAAGGDTFENLLKKRIFDRLSMTSTGTSTKALDSMKNVATPHEWIDGKQQPVPYRNLDTIVPAGGITSCVADMANWLKMEIADGTFEGKQVIKADRMKEMHEYQISIAPSATMIAAMPDELYYIGYGMGMYTQLLRGVRVLRHSGGIDGIATTCGYFPDKKIGVCILSNANAQVVMGTFYSLVEFYGGHKPRDWIKLLTKAYKETDGKWVDEHPASRLAGRVEGTKPSQSLDKYCGKYSNNIYGDLTVSLVNDKLLVDFGPERVADLEHHQYDTFKLNWRRWMNIPYPMLANFIMDPQGHIVEVELDELDKFKKQ